MGQHAEAHCLQRANRRRLTDSTLYVASRRRRNLKTIESRPCSDCERLLRGVGRVVYRNARGEWVKL